MLTAEKSGLTGKVSRRGPISDAPGLLGSLVTLSTTEGFVEDARFSYGALHRSNGREPLAVLSAADRSRSLPLDGILDTGCEPFGEESNGTNDPAPPVL